MSLARKRRRLAKWIRYDKQCGPHEVVHPGRIRAAEAVDKALGARYNSEGMNIRMRVGTPHLTSE